MTSTPPNRDEGYSPEPNERQQRSEADVGDDAEPEYQPAPPSAWARRGLIIAAVAAVPVVGLLGFNAFHAATSSKAEKDPEPELLPDEERTDDYVAGFEIAVGDYSATVADGWTSVDDGKGGVVVTSGANRLTVVSVIIPKAAPAVDEIAGLARSHADGFVGTFGEPVDRSSGDVKRASVAGTGKFQGAAARLLCELWIDATGFALLTTRILTAKPDS